MAIEKTEGGASKKMFVNINGKDGTMKYREGKGQPDIVTQAGKARVTGLITGIYTKDDVYEGQANTKATVVLSDGDTEQHVAFTIWTAANETSAFGLRLLAALNAATPGEPVAVLPWCFEAGHTMPDGVVLEKARTGVTVYQGKDKVVPVFGKDADGKPIVQLPKAPMVRVSATKEMANKDEWANITKELLGALAAKYNPSPADDDHHDETVDLDEAGNVAGAPRMAA